MNKHQRQWTSERLRTQSQALNSAQESTVPIDRSPTFAGIRLFIVLSPLSQYLSVKNHGL